MIEELSTKENAKIRQDYWTIEDGSEEAKNNNHTNHKLRIPLCSLCLRVRDRAYQPLSNSGKVNPLSFARDFTHKVNSSFMWEVVDPELPLPSSSSNEVTA